MGSESRFFPPILACFFLLAVTGCDLNSDQNPFSDRSKNVVDAAIYSESRVFFLNTAGSDDQENVAELKPLRSSLAGPSDPQRIKRGSPLTTIVDSVTIPGGASAPGRKMDILVVVDLETAIDGGDKSIAVWYETGVYPGRSLNFSNLIIDHQGSWDPRVAPLFRIRVIDVALEKNLQVRQIFDQVGAFAPEIGKLIPYPGTSSLIGIAAKAAKFALASAKNRTLLDYTFQLYSENVIRESAGRSGGAELGELRRGSFAVVGLPNNPKFIDRSFWKENRGKLIYDFDSRELIIKEDNKQTRHLTPIVKLTLATSESVVPSTIVKRSAFLTKMFQDLASQIRPETLEAEMGALNRSVTAFVAAERVNRFGLKQDVCKAGRLLEKHLGEQNEKEEAFLDSEDVFYVMRALSAAATRKFREEHPTAAAIQFESAAKAEEWALKNCI